MVVNNLHLDICQGLELGQQDQLGQRGQQVHHNRHRKQLVQVLFLGRI